MDLKEIFTVGGTVNGVLTDGIDIPPKKVDPAKSDSLTESISDMPRVEHVGTQSTDGGILTPWSESDLDNLSAVGPEDAPGALENSTPKLRSLNEAAPDETSA